MPKTKYIHVNKQFIAQNAKDGGNRPVYTIKEGKSGKAIYCRSFTIKDGNIRGVSDTDQLSCGARVWLETESEIEYHDQMTFSEAKECYPVLDTK